MIRPRALVNAMPWPAQCAALRDLFGERLDARHEAVTSGAWPEAVKRVAREMYEARAFARMTQLADALEAAEWPDRRMALHARNVGPHVRGCWLTDRVLGTA
jgi:hypothetical protein